MPGRLDTELKKYDLNRPLAGTGFSHPIERIADSGIVSDKLPGSVSHARYVRRLRWRGSGTVTHIIPQSSCGNALAIFQLLLGGSRPYLIKLAREPWTIKRALSAAASNAAQTTRRCG